MRLTLRTLLAYRDGVLNPAESADMHARIQQSAMAGNLLKRIESLSNRPTILAPPVDGKGLGADANSIAEYLDDALKGEKVPELERICLESDVQLAELAQCHQLLSSALSTTVDVPAPLRERIAALSDPAARAKALAQRPTGLVPEQAAAGAMSASVTPRLEGKARFRTDPSHTHPSTQRTADTAQRGPSAPAGDRSDKPSVRATRVVAAQPLEAPMVASGGDSIKPTGLDLEGSHLAHEVPEYLRGSTRDGWRGPLAIGALVAVLALLVWQSMGSLESVREMFSKRATTEPNELDLAVESSAPPSNLAPGGPNARRSDQDDGQVNNDADAANPTANDPPVANGSQANARPANNNAQGSAQDNTGQPHAAQWLPSDADAMQAIILVRTTGAQPLHRMQAAERLPNGTQIVVPPASRPTLDLARGPLWTFCGPTQMSVSLPDTGEQAEPRVDLRLGKALITAGSQGQTVLVNSPDSQVRLSLGDATCRVAIELSYTAVAHGPMSDRQANPPVMLISVIEGQASLTTRGPSGGPASAATDLTAGQSVWVARGVASPTQPADDALAWVDASADRPIDVLAAQDLQRQLTADVPVGQTLGSLVANRRPETRAIAAETLALLGNWDWIAVEKNTLNEPRDRSYWTPLLDLTRQMIGANPEDGNRLRALLVSRDAQRGSFQADMWLGLTQAQLDKEGLGRLINVLDSEVLLDRILAIYQLQRLTGKDLGYQADEVNRAAVQQWNRELASDRVQLLPLTRLPK